MNSPGTLLTTSDHHYYGLGLHPVKRRKVSRWYVQKENREQPKESCEFITKSLCFEVKNPNT